jgi:hypothetical protein
MSEVKVNKISPRTNCGTTTLGDSGDSFVIPSGVTITNNGTQTGFGRTGTVDWQTGDIKTATFTAESGKGYFCNTTGGSFEVDLPAGSAGAIVSVQDYNNTFDSNALQVDPNGSEKINGGTAGETVTLSTEGQGVTFVYIDSTVGWRSVQDNQFSQAGTPPFVSATGGTIATDGNFKVHTFTGPGTFTVTSVAPCAANNAADYLVVAGGASGGGDRGGGGGAGGFRYFLDTTRCAPTSGAPGAPLNGYGSPTPSGTAITLAAQSYPIVVGGGGAGSSGGQQGNNGNVSTFSTVTSAGGGFGGGCQGGTTTGGPGGSGGGGRDAAGTTAGGTGNTPSTTPAQGTNGAPSTAANNRAGGGGGATVAGGTGAPPGGGGGAGAGLPTAFGPANGVANPSPDAFRYYAGGGEGGDNCAGSTAGGGLGGGGNRSPGVSGVGTAGTANTGGGSGGNNNNTNAGNAGGSGIVVIRYKFQ